MKLSDAMKLAAFVQKRTAEIKKEFEDLASNTSMVSGPGIARRMEGLNIRSLVIDELVRFSEYLEGEGVNGTDDNNDRP